MANINSDKIIDEIEKRRVVPIPRWRFMLKRAGVWGLALTSVMTGAISMATAIYVFFDNDYLTDHAGIEKLFVQRPLIEVIVRSIPYAWLVTLALFMIAAYYSFRHTRRGYRYSVFRVVAGSVLLSVMLSGILHTFGIGKHVHRYLIDNVKGYGSLVYTNDVLWAQQEKGLLGGKVVRYSRCDSTVVIRDYRHHFWRVDISRARKHRGAHIAVGKYLKITGFKTGTNSFRAATIRPWVKKRHKKSTPPSAPAQSPPVTPSSTAEHTQP